jgi:hypothetical protein
VQQASLSQARQVRRFCSFPRSLSHAMRVCAHGEAVQTQKSAFERCVQEPNTSSSRPGSMHTPTNHAPLAPGEPGQSRPACGVRARLRSPCNQTRPILSPDYTRLSARLLAARRRRWKGDTRLRLLDDLDP